MRSRPASILRAALLLAVAMRMVCLTSFHAPEDNDLGAAPGAAGWRASAPPADSCPACSMDTLLVGPPAVAPPIDAPESSRAARIFRAVSRLSLTLPPGVGRAPPSA